MLQRRDTPHQMRQYAMLVAVELEDGVCTEEQASFTIQDALRWREGVGAVTADCLGEITDYEKTKDEPGI